MNRYKRYIPIAALILLAFGVNLDRFGIDLNKLSGGSSTTSSSSTSNSSGNDKNSAASDNSGSSHPDYTQWSKTDPNINLWHIFEGEINRSGKPVGFHARPGGQDPAGARVLSLKDKPNGSGVYTASIEIRDGDQWKKKFSSYPF